MESIRIQLALLTVDNDGGNAVADEIRESLTLAHEFINPEQKGERLDGNVRNDR